MGFFEEKAKGLEDLSLVKPSILKPCDQPKECTNESTDLQIKRVQKALKNKYEEDLTLEAAKKNNQYMSYNEKSKLQ